MTQTVEPLWLVKAKQHYQHDELPLAKQLLQANAKRPEARLLLIRCLTDQGYFLEAVKLCHQGLDAIKGHSEIKREMVLRCAYLQIYLAGNIQACVEAGKAIMTSKVGGENWLTAVALDLTARARVAGMSWEKQEQAAFQECAQQLAAAANLYRQLGYEAEAATAQIKQAQTWLMMSPPERSSAKELFQQIQQQAQANNLRQFEAKATLYLAELAFDEALKKTLPDKTSPAYLTLYEKALASYEQANNVLGMADVHQSWGERLVKAGFDGREPLQQALDQYKQQDNLIGMSRVISPLAIYHVRQGKLTEGLVYHEQSLELAQKMGFKQAEATAQMGLGDIYFRTGDYANALAAYEQAEKLTSSPIIHGLINLNLANTYTLMNLPDRAEAVCRVAISKLAVGGPNANLSLAYFILGNILGAKQSWNETLAAWRRGLAVDETLGNVHNQVEKLQSMGQATVLQHYRGKTSVIPEMAYEEAMSLFNEAIYRLESLQDNEAAALRANIWQLQGQTAVTARRYEDAENYILQARNQYDELQMGMQTATTDAILGLLYYGVSNEGQNNLYDSAIACYQRALTYYQSVNMRDQMWPIHYYMANAFFRRGLLQLTAETQTSDWQLAHQALREAAEIVDFIRGRFSQTDRLAQEEARVGLVANKEKLYRFALSLTSTFLKDKVSTFNWLQRYKGRTFVDALTITPLHPSEGDDQTLLREEANLLEALNQESDQLEAVSLLAQLQQIWAQMVMAGFEEYVSLRRGDPVQWSEMPNLLRVST